MIYISTLTVILCGFLCSSQVFGAAIYHEPIDQTPLAATCSAETAAQVYASIVYINLISSHDPKVVFELNVPSDIAAELYYQEKLRIFLEKGFANAEELAARSAGAISIGKKFTIDYFYFISAITIGEFLAEKGFLNCYNVIERATQFFEIEQKLFKSLGSDVFDSYVGAILRGVYDVLLRDLGYNIEEDQDVFSLLSDLFYTEYSKYISYISAKE